MKEYSRVAVVCEAKVDSDMAQQNSPSTVLKSTEVQHHPERCQPTKGPEDLSTVSGWSKLDYGVLTTFQNEMR